MNKKEFINITGMLEENYNRQMDIRIINLWYEEFKDYPGKYYQEIINEVIRSEKYMPTLAKMIELKKPLWYYEEVKKEETTEDERLEIESLLEEYR